MADRPILFSAPMVRALLDGRKTQTRRVLKPDPDTLPNGFAGVRMPYAPGDRLYVREAWRSASCYDDLAPSAMSGEEPVRYEEDALWQTWGWGAPLRSHGRLRQGIHMPRWASRLTLTVTDVRVQRLQEISEADAVAEGVNPCLCGHNCPNGEHGGCCGICEPVTAYAELWTELHGPGAWAANPWVCALTFTVRRGNIDEASDG